MPTLCTTTLQAAASLCTAPTRQAAGLVDQMYDLGHYEDGSPRSLVSLSRPVSTQFLCAAPTRQEVTMSYKTKAAVAAAAHSDPCSNLICNNNSTHILIMQEGGAK